MEKKRGNIVPFEVANAIMMQSVLFLELFQTGISNNFKNNLRYLVFKEHAKVNLVF